MSNTKFFNFLAAGFSLVAFVTILIYVFKFSDVINPTDPDGIVYQFDWHAALGAFGVLISLYLGGQAFHVVRGSLASVQVIHVLFVVSGIIAMSVALGFMFNFHKQQKPEPLDDMYSVHSWAGLAFFVLFGLQLFLGVSTVINSFLPTFLALPTLFLRAIHKSFGHGLIAAGAAAIITGIFDRQRIVTDFGTEGNFTTDSRWANAAAVFTLLAAVFTAFSLTVKVPRPASEEEKPLNTDLPSSGY